jgi:hypothetical protein|tara:strand:+ start:945 stop:1136 length:192 start_codon:yes stop_codon:yes gene_type:complete
MNLKPFVNDKHLYDDFLEELKDRIRIAQSSLEIATDTSDVFRSQGEIRALRKLLKLREKVNEG